MRYTYGDKMRVEWLCKEARTIFDVLKLEERDDPVFYRLGKFLKSYKIHKLQSYNLDMGVSKNRGTPKMDGENNGKPYFLMDDLGGKPTIFGNIHGACSGRPGACRVDENRLPSSRGRGGPLKIDGWLVQMYSRN